MLSRITVGGPIPFLESSITDDIHAYLHTIIFDMLRFMRFGVLPPFIARSPARIGEERRQANIENT